MKKIIILFIIALTAGLPAAIARKVNVVNPDQHVLDAFKKEFKTAHDVSWEKEEGYDKAIFGLSGHRVIAYFNADAQLEGCIRDLFYDQLPLAVMTAIDKRFVGADIFSVREIANANGTSYQVVLEQKGKKYTVKLAAEGIIREVVKFVN